MSILYDIPSSDPLLLQKATRLAEEFAAQYRIPGVTGIAFLGAIVRGYFDHSADVDVAVFKQPGCDVPFKGQFQHEQGIEIHCHMADYGDEAAAEWSMPKRWTFSQAKIVHDPQGELAALLADKVPLKDDERKWLLMSGICLSEWYINRLSDLWVERGNMTSAHQMMARGLEYFLDMLFGLNNELVPDTKWKYYCAEKLPRLPADFRTAMQATMLLNDFSLQELERRKQAFMQMWQTMLPVIEGELKMTYAEIMDVV